MFYHGSRDMHERPPFEEEDPGAWGEAEFSAPTWQLPDDYEEANWLLGEGGFFLGLQMETILDPFWQAGYNIRPGEPERYPTWLRAQAFLFVVLRSCQVAPARAVAELAWNAGVSGTALRRARKTLRIVSTKREGVRHGGWWWRLPPGLEQLPDLEEFDWRWGWYLSYRPEDKTLDLDAALARHGLTQQR
jgi:hypothetical protein